MYEAHRHDFGRNGYVVLPRFYDATEIDALVEQIEKRKAERPLHVIVDRLDTGERTSLGLLSPDEIRTVRMKINDLFLDMEPVRELALSSRLGSLLAALFGHRPVLCNSLLLERGSAQPPHVDSIYMTPQTSGHLIASWVALEDAHDDAGPLEYFPGSHLIPPMRFSNGTYHFEPNEMPRWEEYMRSNVAKRGIEKKTFSAKKGDVFIWHANLLHGGGVIKNTDLTRKSLVFHYYSEWDCRNANWQIQSHRSAFWLDRPPQPLPPEAASKLPFSEDNYLRRYPDVAEAVKTGVFERGLDHFELHGREEGRLPY
jgi:ectoine hydroxylase-related dioxygenase (phytanoyl-CoA dioxygenase family)